MNLSVLPEADPVSFDLGGAPLVLGAIAGDPPLLVVEPVTDALKVVSGDRIVGSVDKAKVLAVAGFVLSRDLVHELGDGDYSPEELVARVHELGHVWSLSR